MIKKFKSSLTAKIFLVTSLLLMTVCVLTYGFIAWTMPMSYTANLSSKLETNTQQLIEQLKKSTLKDSQSLLDQFAVSANADVRIFDTKNKATLNYITGTYVTVDEVLTTADSVGTPDPEHEAEQSAAEGTLVKSGKSYQFHFSDDGTIYTLMVMGRVQLQSVNQATEALTQILPWLILTILLISLLGSLFYSRYVTRPILKLSGTAKKMSKLEFGWQCDDIRMDEIGVLGRSLNELSEKLSTALIELRTANLSLQNDIEKERELERQRLEFFSAVSHELKTPITVIKGQLEGMLGNVGVYKDHETYLAKCLSVATAMENMVQEILTITRMDSSSFAPQMELLNLSALVAGQLDAYDDFLEQKALHLHTALTPGLTIAGDRKLLQKAISNLLSNAARYSAPGETVYVRTVREKENIVLTVENTGVRISEEAITHLFEAFYRVERSRNRQTGGSGLGLYLVARISELHGAECRIENFENGVRAKLHFSAV